MARERAQGEEIQLAETKLVMHRELLEKDEQVYNSRQRYTRPFMYCRKSVLHLLKRMFQDFLRKCSTDLR